MNTSTSSPSKSLRLKWSYASCKPLYSTGVIAIGSVIFRSYERRFGIGSLHRLSGTFWGLRVDPYVPLLLREKIAPYERNERSRRALISSSGTSGTFRFFKNVPDKTASRFKGAIRDTGPRLRDGTRDTHS